MKKELLKQADEYLRLQKLREEAGSEEGREKISMEMLDQPISWFELIKALADEIRGKELAATIESMRITNLALGAKAKGLEFDKGELVKALEEIEKTLDINCRKAPGEGSTNMIAIAQIGKITYEAIKDISK